MSNGKPFPTIYHFAEIDGRLTTIRLPVTGGHDHTGRGHGRGVPADPSQRVEGDVRARFQRRAFPFFQETQNGPDPVGEDLTFCLRLASLGIPVHVHTGVKIGHHKSTSSPGHVPRRPPAPGGHRCHCRLKGGLVTVTDLEPPAPHHLDEGRPGRAGRGGLRHGAGVGMWSVRRHPATTRSGRTTCRLSRAFALRIAARSGSTLRTGRNYAGPEGLSTRRRRRCCRGSWVRLTAALTSVQIHTTPGVRLMDGKSVIGMDAIEQRFRRRQRRRTGHQSRRSALAAKVLRP